MAYAPVRLWIGQPSLYPTETVVVTPITGGRILKQILITNTGTVASALNLTLAISGVNTVASRLLFNYSVAAGAVAVLDLSQVMNSGEGISCSQTVSGALTVCISGVSF